MEMESGPEPPRLPEQADLVTLCRALNEHGVRYIIVGGMAMIQQGFLRATEDIDLLLEGSRPNVSNVREALEFLPDKAVREMQEDDLERYTVVRVADDIVINLMLSTCGITYDEAQADIEWVTLDGVSIPFANTALLLRMKQTQRERDVLDRLFLEQKIARQG